MKHNGHRPNPDAPPSYKGGSTYLTENGYVMEQAPWHPKCDQRGYVQQHRLVAEDVLGRFLSGLEIVHHKSRDKTNNHPDNLEVLASRSLHMREHGDETRERCLVPLTENQVKEALSGKSTAEAAELLGVNHQTLRNRFPHLLVKRMPPGDLDRQAEEICNFATEHHSPFEAIRVVAMKNGCCDASVKAAIRRWSSRGDSAGESARRLRSRLAARPGPKRRTSFQVHASRERASAPLPLQPAHRP